MVEICSKMFCKLLLFVYLMDLSLTEYVKVQTAYGRVTGTRKVVNNFRIETFLGVPYAKPPVGDLRFRRPIPLTQYPPEGINATKLPSSCIQPIDKLFGMHEGVEMWNPNTNISEDCLYMNIWRPWKRKGLLPVLIWIYGGTYISGSCSLDIYDGSILAEKAQAIVVAMNYRTGPLGFFYLNDRGGEVPGSQGIADQQIVIRYFWNYAKDWGGDRNRITLSGESSGAVSIGLHLLSDAVQYVSGVILNSATPLARWGIQSREKALKRAELLSRKLKCWSDNDREIIKCLRSKPAKDFLDNMYHVQEHYFEPPFGPTIDGNILKNHPRDILESGKFKRIPMIIGNTKDEGMYFFIYGFPEVYKELNNTSTWNSTHYFYYLRKIVKSVSEKYYKIVEKATDFEYRIPTEFRNQQKLPDIMDDIVGDLEFVCSTVNFSTYYASQGNPVYMYRFMHKNEKNPWPEWMGAMHGYEIDYEFGTPFRSDYPFIKFNDKERRLSDSVIKYWKQFIHNPKKPIKFNNKKYWPRFDKKDRKYLMFNISNSDEIGEGGLRTRKCKFWETFIPNLITNLDNLPSELGYSSLACINVANIYVLIIVLLNIT